MRFASEAAEERYIGLWREQRAAAKGWQAPPPVRSAMLLEQWWCSAEVPVDDCWTGTVRRATTQPSRWRGLSVVFDEGEDVGLLEVDAGRVDEVWGMALTLRVEAATGELTDWTAELVRYASNRETARFQLGSALFGEVELSSYTVEGPPLDALLASPESFASASNGSVEALRDEMMRALDAGEVRRCAYGRYYGDGRPRCDRVPLTQQEVRGWRDQVEQDQGYRLQLLRSEAEVLHGMLVALVPEAAR